MSEFCEGCPLRGSCVGQIEDVITHRFEQRHPNRTYIFTKCYDLKDNASRLFHTKLNESQVYGEIDTCSSPKEVDERIGIFTHKSRPTIVCGALKTKPTNMTWFEQPFDDAVSEEGDTDVIDKEIYRVESRRFVRRVLMPLGALGIIGAGSMLFGAAESNSGLAVGGMLAVFISINGLGYAIIRDSKRDIS